MSKYIGPKLKLCRREGTDLFLKSNLRNIKDKCNIDRLPGQHYFKKHRLSDYGLQLREKQKLRRIYGVLEKQFINYYYKALKLKGNTGDNLIKFLERRLDNVIYRMRFSSTRSEARQMINHKSIIVNDNLVDIPSYLVNCNDVIKCNVKSGNASKIKYNLSLHKNSDIPSWIEVSFSKLEGIFKYVPNRKSILFDIKEHLILEFYSK